MRGHVHVGGGRRTRAVGIAWVATLALLAVGCSDDDLGRADQSSPSVTTAPEVTTTTAPPAPDTIVVVTTGGGLEAWAAQPGADGSFRHQPLEIAGSTAEDGTTVSAGELVGGVCSLPGAGTGRQVVVGDLGGSGRGPGWTVVRIEGDRVGSLQATAVGTLGTSWAGASPRPMACAVLGDGRIATTTVDLAPGGTGELVLWFPGPDGLPVACKLDLALVGGRAALARPDPAGGEELLVATSGGVVRYRAPLPTAPDPDGGCGGRDPAGVPTALVATVPWLTTEPVDPAAGLAPAPEDSVFVARAGAGTVDRHDRDGVLGAGVVTPGPQEVVGPVPRLSGSPGALAVDRVGTLFYTDAALVTDPVTGAITAADGKGTLRRVRFEADSARAPEVMGAGLDRPEGVAALPPDGGGRGSALLVP